MRWRQGSPFGYQTGVNEDRVRVHDASIGGTWGDLERARRERSRILGRCTIRRCRVGLCGSEKRATGRSTRGRGRPTSPQVGANERFARRATMHARQIGHGADKLGTAPVRSAGAAFAETLFRGSYPRDWLTRAEIASRRLGRIGLRRDLVLADLTGSDPESSLGAALREGPAAYARLRHVAASLYRQGPPVDGLLRARRQLGESGMLCAMLFDDRVSGEHDLPVIEVLEIEGGEGLRRLRAAATARGFALPRALALRAGPVSRDRPGGLAHPDASSRRSERSTVVVRPSLRGNDS